MASYGKNKSKNYSFKEGNNPLFSISNKKINLVNYYSALKLNNKMDLKKHSKNINVITYNHIQYKKMDEPFEKEVEHPFELFFKNKQFYDQHEGRIVVNTLNPVLKEYLTKNTIDVGSLEDICVIFDQYPAGGIESFIDLNI